MILSIHTLSNITGKIPSSFFEQLIRNIVLLLFLRFPIFILIVLLGLLGLTFFLAFLYERNLIDFGWRIFVDRIVEDLH